MNQTHRALAEHIDTELSHDIGEVTAVGWHGPVNMSFDEWVRIGNTLLQIDSSINWWIGDWLNYGEAKYGETYAQAIIVTGWKEQRLMDAKWVANAVQFSVRTENLSWTHHKHVAKLPPDEQQYWLGLAAKTGMRSGELREAVLEKQGKIQRPPEIKNDNLPFGGATPQIHHNGNGYHRALVDEYEQQADEWRENGNGYTWGDNEPKETEIEDSSDSDEYYTPPIFISAARHVMGSIELDPASCGLAQSVVGASLYYTKEDNGLNKDWRGRVWLNPPFSTPKPFVFKAIHEYEAGNIEQAIILVNNGTETEWGQALLRRFPVCFVGHGGEASSRISFWRTDPEQPEKGNRYAQMIFYIGNNRLQFFEVFSRFGVVAIPVDGEVQT